MQLRFQFQRETKGALRFLEVDEDGKPVEMAWAHDRPGVCQKVSIATWRTLSARACSYD